MIIGNEEGPYILSDRRYKDSKCIYYRYGGFKPNPRKSYEGIIEYVLVTPDNKEVVDGRKAYCDFPAWVKDPFESEEWFIKIQDELNNNPSEYLNNKYKVEKVIQFSTTGGVYKAVDIRNNNVVLIKEARPYTQSTEFDDAIVRLKTEKEFMEKFNDKSYIPKYIDYFTEWEHSFLVMEYIDGVNFTKYMNQNNSWSNINTLLSDYEYRKKLLSIWINIAKYIKDIHKENWCLGDLSINNVMIKEEKDNTIPILIDFEGSFKIGSEERNIVTYGFCPKNLKIDPKKRDMYSLASIIIGSIYPINNLYGILNEENKKNIRKYLLELKGFGDELSYLLNDILWENFSLFNNIDDIITFLEKLEQNELIEVKDNLISIDSVIALKERLITCINKRINYSARDKILPCDPNLYFMNNFNVRYGAAGVAYAIKYVNGTIDSKLGGWLLEKDYSDEVPGLYNGLSGLSWVLLECGYDKFALNILEEIIKDENNYKDVTFGNGAAGIALAALNAYYKTKENKWLMYAKDIGYYIISIANKELNNEISWKDSRGFTYIGLHNGTSGTAYLLLELYLATKDIKFLENAEYAVNFILSNIKKLEKHYATPIDPIEVDKINVVSPYLSNGTAGVLHLLLRYYSIKKDNNILNYIEHLIKDLDRPITPFTSLEQGMAGIVNVLIDACIILKNENYINIINRYITTIAKYEIVDSNNLSYLPGEQLFRVSDDYFTGSLGALCVLNRYEKLVNKEELFNFNFTLDKYHTLYYWGLFYGR